MKRFRLTFSILILLFIFITNISAFFPLPSFAVSSVCESGVVYMSTGGEKPELQCIPQITSSDNSIPIYHTFDDGVTRYANKYNTNSKDDKYLYGTPRVAGTNDVGTYPGDTIGGSGSRSPAFIKFNNDAGLNTKLFGTEFEDREGHFGRGGGYQDYTDFPFDKEGVKKADTSMTACKVVGTQETLPQGYSSGTCSAFVNGDDRGCKKAPSNAPFKGCTFVPLRINGVNQNVYYCPDTAVGNICKSKGTERASIITEKLVGAKLAGSYTEPYSAQWVISSSANSVLHLKEDFKDTLDIDRYRLIHVRGLMFACNDPSKDNSVVVASKTVTDSLPALSYCCDAKTGKPTDKVSNDASGPAKGYGRCDWGYQFDSGGSCKDKPFLEAHPQQCACEYDASQGVYNGASYTALGCLPANLGSLTNIIIGIAIGIASIISLIRIIIGGYEIMTNPAGPDEIKEGQKMIINAVLGLMLIIFCVIILRIIGFNILGIGPIGTLYPQ